MREDRARMVAELASVHAAEMAALLGNGEGSARARFRELYTWSPDFLPEEIVKEFEEAGGEGVPPFFSEMTLYALLGKEEARNLLAMMRCLGEALGIDNVRDLHVEAERDSEGVDRRAPLTHEDIDALEGFMREDASYRFSFPGDGAANKIIRISKTITALRSIVEGDSDYEWLHLIPDEVQVGDRIFSRGRFITVHGFLDKDKKVVDRPIPFGDPLASYEVPRKTRKRDRSAVILAHAGVIKTSEYDDWGWCLDNKQTLQVLREKKDDEAEDRN